MRVQAPLVMLVAVLIRFNWIHTLAVGSSALLFFSLPLILKTLSGEIQRRSMVLSIFNDSYARQFGKPTISLKLKLLSVQSLSLHFHPWFLFVQGDSNLRHSTRRVGVWSVLDLAGVAVLGLVVVLRWRQNGERHSTSRNRCSLCLGVFVRRLARGDDLGRHAPRIARHWSVALPEPARRLRNIRVTPSYGPQGSLRRFAYRSPSYSVSISCQIIFANTQNNQKVRLFNLSHDAVGKSETPQKILEQQEEACSGRRKQRGYGKRKLRRTEYQGRGARPRAPDASAPGLLVSR